MDMLNNPNNPNRPPTLDGTNYAVWKTKMRQYIKSIDERAWRCVLTPWSIPMTEKDDDSVEVVESSTDATDPTKAAKKKPKILVPKDEATWTTDELNASNYNSKALYAISQYVDPNMYALIQNCETAKDAWDILLARCEGSASVKKARLRILMNEFEALRMDEDETIDAYSIRLLKVSNECQALGNAIANDTLVSKMMRTLPERFNYKISTIEEVYENKFLSLDKLISILTMAEIGLEQQAKHKNKGIALSALECMSSDMANMCSDINKSNLDDDDVVSFISKFSKYLQNKKDGKNQNRFQPPRSFEKKTSEKKSFDKKESPDKKPQSFVNKDISKVQCRACKGFGHYANECANTLKKRGMSLTATLSDSEDEECEFDETANACILDYSSCCESDDDLSEGSLGTSSGSFDVLCLNVTEEKEEMSDAAYAEMVAMYQDLSREYDKSVKEISALAKALTSLNKDNDALHDECRRLDTENTEQKETIARLEVLMTKKDIEFSKLKDECCKANDVIARMNVGHATLDEILNVGTSVRTGLGYKAPKFNISKPTVFVKEGESSVETDKKKAKKKNKVKKKRRYVCHHCFLPGHIRPFCYKLKEESKSRSQSETPPNSPLKNKSPKE